MLAQIIPIARNTFVESVRQPVYLVMLLMAGLLQLINTWVSGFTMGYRSVPGEVTADDKLLFDVSLATVFICGIILASFIATATVSREIENKTVLTVISKPIQRATVILGKFVGVAAAMSIAILVMVAFLLLGIRHGVMTTAADLVDMPVVLFGLGGIGLCVLLGSIGNFMYGWSFPQTASLLLLPVSWLGYGAVLFISDEWAWQDPTTDLKPQIMLACGCLAIALLVMTSVAVAASTRLGQVMTILVCGLVFVLGLMSNFLVGRHVYQNERVGQIAFTRPLNGTDLYTFHQQAALDLAAERAGVTPEDFEAQGFDVRGYVTPRDILAFGPIDEFAYREAVLTEPGSEYQVVLLGPPRVPLEVGDPFYFGASPNGLGLLAKPFTPAPDGYTAESDPTELPSLTIVFIDDLDLVVRQSGREVVPVARPPLARDSVFLEPTRVHPGYLTAWSIIPNMQSFWMVDAITQAQPIPGSHVVLILIYGVFQMMIFVSIAVLLFQGRDVG